MLKKPHAARKRMQLHKSPRNVKMYKETQEETLQVDQAYEEWWTCEAKKVAGLQGKEKWYTINKLLNHSATNQTVQPLRAIVEGKSEYIFDDDGIRAILQQQHIRTTAKEGRGNQQY